MNGAFYHDSNEFIKTSKEETLPAGTLLWHGQAFQSILPTLARQVLRRFFEENGFHDPKISLMHRPNIGLEILFNIDPTQSQFSSKENFYHFLSAIKWYLPSH